MLLRKYHQLLFGTNFQIQGTWLQSICVGIWFQLRIHPCAPPPRHHNSRRLTRLFALGITISTTVARLSNSLLRPNSSQKKENPTTLCSLPLHARSHTSQGVMSLPQHESETLNSRGDGGYSTVTARGSSPTTGSIKTSHPRQESQDSDHDSPPRKRSAPPKSGQPRDRDTEGDDGGTDQNDSEDTGPESFDDDSMGKLFSSQGPMQSLQKQISVF